MLPSFLHRSKRKPDGSGSAAGRAETFSFPPERIVSAIAYHLLDEGIADVIEPEDRAAAVSELSRRMTTLTITKGQWISMSNAQRLNWLMAQGYVGVKSRPDGSAVLWVR